MKLNTLHLVLTRKWFDKIRSGEKKIEYRKATVYWATRLAKIKHLAIDNITFHHGYSKNRESFKIQLKYIEIQMLPSDATPEERKFLNIIDNEMYYALHLGDILEK